MVSVLADARIYEFIGGTAPTLPELTQRYTQQVAGSGRSDEVWLNWIIRRRSDKQPIGYVQATVALRTSRSVAELAWVITPAHQGAGAATEAATAVAAHLRANADTELHAHIADTNVGSVKVAERVGLVATEALNEEGERLYVAMSRRSG